jgi:hypothetical protein
MPAARAFLAMQEFILFFCEGVSFLNGLIFNAFEQRWRNIEFAFIQPVTFAFTFSSLFRSFVSSGQDSTIPKTPRKENSPDVSIQAVSGLTNHS